MQTKSKIKKDHPKGLPVYVIKNQNNNAFIKGFV